MTVKAFFNPASVDEAVELMYSQSGHGEYLAGGTDMLCAKDWPDFVVNVRDLLNTVKKDGDEFVMGASATITQVEFWDELAAADDGLMRKCCKEFASRQIRNMATVGGNIASAVPSADVAPPLMVLEATCVIQGKDGQRTVPLNEFFTGPHESVIDKELLVEIRVPVPAPGVKTEFLKMDRNPGDIAMINVSTLLELDGDTIKKARIALGAVAPTPIRAFEAEAFLEGKPATEENIQQASELAANAARPISDQRASEAYRKHMSMALTRRALQHCLGIREDQ